MHLDHWASLRNPVARTQYGRRRSGCPAGPPVEAAASVEAYDIDGPGRAGEPGPSAAKLREVPRFNLDG